jgi:RNA polymerase sigma-70 factor (ECF subfamily)
MNRFEPSTAFATELRLAIATHTGGLRTHARRLCSTHGEAEDVLHDTIERALRFEDTYEPGTNVRAWLHQILFSVFVSRCRKQRREREALERLQADPCAWVRAEPAAQQSLGASVQRALAELPDPYRAVVELVDLRDSSYKDAAEKLNVPVGTVMSRLFRARRLLATALGAPAAGREAA